MKHKPYVISIKVNKNTYEILCSYVRILYQERNGDKVDTSFLENEAKKLLKRLAKK